MSVMVWEGTLAEHHRPFGNFLKDINISFLLIYIITLKNLLFNEKIKFDAKKSVAKNVTRKNDALSFSKNYQTSKNKRNFWVLKKVVHQKLNNASYFQGLAQKM